MKMRMAMLLFATCLAAAGCSNDGKGEAEETNPAAEQETKETDAASANSLEKEEAGKEEAAVETLSLPARERANSAEELAEFPPGELTEEFSLERETSMWIGKEVHSDIRSQFLEQMEPITAETSDPEELYGALLHFLAGARYEESVKPLLEYTPNFKEPILPEPYEITEDGKPSETPKNAVILLDASSSMLLMADGRLKMETAKNAVKGFAQTIGSESDVSLYVYGHAGTQNKSDKELSCTTIDEVYPLNKYVEKDFDKAVNDVKAAGWTPLAGAIRKAHEDHEGTDDDITLYIVSDGAETCDGDPVEEAKKFAELSADRHVNVIGFQVDSTAESQLKAVAEAGNGTYLAADTLDEMSTGISKMWIPSELDLVGLMYTKADAWPKTMALDEVRRMHDSANSTVRIESDRLEGAANLLEREKMIDTETKEKLLAIIEEHRSAYKGMVDGLKEEKRRMIDDEIQRIDSKIDDYIERMRNLKKGK